MSDSTHSTERPEVDARGRRIPPAPIEVEAHGIRPRFSSAEVEAHMPLRKGPANEVEAHAASRKFSPPEAPETEAHAAKAGRDAETEAHAAKYRGDVPETEAHAWGGPAIGDPGARIRLSFPPDAESQTIELRYRPATSPGGMPEVELHRTFHGR